MESRVREVSLRAVNHRFGSNLSSKNVVLLNAVKEGSGELALPVGKEAERSLRSRSENRGAMRRGRDRY